MERLPRNDRATELRQLVRRLEARHPSTHGHSRRVAGHAAALAAELGLAEGMVAKIRTAALLHDVGKSEVPSEILDKPGPLTPTESERMRVHAYYTDRVLARPPALARIGAVAALPTSGWTGPATTAGSRDRLSPPRRASSPRPTPSGP